MNDCTCNGVVLCKTHFEAQFSEDYQKTPQYQQQYGGFRGMAPIGWPGNGLGIVRQGRDDEWD